MDTGKLAEGAVFIQNEDAIIETIFEIMQNEPDT